MTRAPTDLHRVDWTRLPAPQDDGGADHLVGLDVPSIPLPSTRGGLVDLARCPGRVILFAYPMTGRPDQDLPPDWDLIPGARGCTPQACAFADRAADLRSLGVASVFGLSTQSPTDQAEAAERLHLPFALLSDSTLAFATALALPLMTVAGRTLTRRLTMVIDDARISTVFYPVFPPDRAAADVINWIIACRDQAAAPSSG